MGVVMVLPGLGRSILSSVVFWCSLNHMSWSGKGWRVCIYVL